MHSVNDNAMPPNILIVSSQSQERDTHTHTYIYIYTPLLRIIFALVCVSIWYHLGPRKQKGKSTLMTAIRRSCSCTYIHTYSYDGHSPQGEREKK
jgi:hypothetical protein